MSDYSDYSSGEEDLFRAPRVFNERGNPLLEMTEERFKTRFRLSKDTVRNLEERLRGPLQPRTRRNMPLTPISMVLLTLRFFATGSFQIVIGDLFKIDKATACRAIHRVTREIATLYGEFIKMPRGENEFSESKRQFYTTANFPGVIGAIDCTHVPITSPGGENAEVFRNRHGWFSINVQAICDAKMRFINVVVRWPGSAHDSNIFRNSRVHAQFESGEFPQCILIGDSGYHCCHYLLTPVLNEETAADQNYNRAHKRTRSVIERTFGVVKRRFPCLSFGLRVKLNKVPNIIVATFVLHNIAVMSGEDFLEIDNDVPQDLFLEVPEPAENQVDRREDTAVRTALINNKFR